MLKLYVKMKTMARDESGATIVEYGVALTIVTAIAVATLTALGADVNGQFTNAETLIP
ncbi:Flp family type IVb pilin [Ruegeria conchae]|uniref:Flp pilus assembly pilin Flp n=1 Tax=Ruegeria conchae TaxID=981384 RepID=A0A497Z364_9RHOB|nr:Flp family type IVb pilin [Ruegeria conchae]RLK02850.1 Flp pilus assembly pilin Flp [Ruegeria conchae]UWR03229.1 Flp family type IVb pilin [Ruegeria conchae]